jgi:Flp pilus assembly protein TadG
MMKSHNEMTLKELPRRDRRGSVGMWVAFVLPAVFAALALGIEVGAWESTKATLQRTADMAAMAGVMNYNASGNATTATNQAIYMAELNGIPSSQISVSTVNGLQNAADKAIQITLSKPVPLMITSAFSATPTYTVSATATAEWVTVTTLSTAGGAGQGGQPCLVAMSNGGVISGSGTTNLTTGGCTLRSNGTITFSGSGSLTTSGIYAGGSITIPNWFSVTGSQYPNDGTIADPYAGNTALQTALTTAAGLSGADNIACGSVSGVNGTAGQYTGNNNCNGTNTLPNGGTCVTNGKGVTCTMYPGNYGSLITSGGGPYTFNLQPGLYLFGGQVSLTNSTTTNGTAVTIVAAKGFTGQNTFNFNVTAPSPTDAGSTGGIAPIALASKSTTNITLSGSVNFAVDGIVYWPNATFDASGSSGNIGAYGNSCLEILAGSIKLSGNSNFNSLCNSLGAASFGSTGATTKSSSQIVK